MRGGFFVTTETDRKNERIKQNKRRASLYVRRWLNESRDIVAWRALDTIKRTEQTWGLLVLKNSSLPIEIIVLIQSYIACLNLPVPKKCPKCGKTTCTNTIVQYLRTII